MVFMNLMLTLCVLVLATCNYQACARNYQTWNANKYFEAMTHTQFSNKGLCVDSVNLHGYKCHEFQVTTKGGYILSLQRIPEGRYEDSSNTVPKKEPVIIQHGLVMDGSSWFMNSPEQNIPTILADNGFDVWVTNTRGTKYSRNHTFLDPANQEYWDWSWDELVSDELPAIIDFVSNQTGQQQINYVGHSLGTLIAMVSMSEGRWINKVKAVALLSPVAYLSHMTTPLGIISAKSAYGKKFTPGDVSEFDPKSQNVLDYVKGVCHHTKINCNDLLTLITGENCCLDEKAFVEFMKVEPQSTSMKNLFHLASTYLNDRVAKFDYGRAELNMDHYGEQRPPIYNLSNIPTDIPIFMSHGGRDALADVIDVKNLLNLHFRNHDKDKLLVQFIEEYAHGDYMMAVNANQLVYNNVTSFFKQF